jgi:hypothetical protein
MDIQCSVTAIRTRKGILMEYLFLLLLLILLTLSSREEFSYTLTSLHLIITFQNLSDQCQAWQFMPTVLATQEAKKEDLEF